MKNQSVRKRIGALSRATHRFFWQKFKKLSIGHAQAVTLHFICRNNGIGQKELVQHFGMDKSSITSQLKILEKNGYIERKIDANDSRGRKIFTTPKTKAVEPELYEIFSSWSELLLKGFNEDEKEFLFRFLDRMIVNAQQALEDLKEDEEN